MIATSVGDMIKDRIGFYSDQVFNKLGITQDRETICHELAQVDSNGLKATFYFKGLDNVKRKEFNNSVNEVASENSNLKIFKVKSKRPEKEVRFYIEIAN